MSYDFEIRSDALYSGGSSLRAVTEVLSHIPFVSQTSESTFEFTLESLDIYAEIYCEYMNDQGESTDLSEIEHNPEVILINCVRVCVPYANLHRDKRDELYTSLGGEVAKQLNWKVVDLQINAEQADTGDIRAVLESLK
jgi:hypothetical protein